MSIYSTFTIVYIVYMFYSALCNCFSFYLILLIFWIDMNMVCIAN